MSQQVFRNRQSRYIDQTIAAIDEEIDQLEVRVVVLEVASATQVVGPLSSTDNALARFDLTTGKLIQNSGVLLDDSDNLSNINDISLAGLVDGRDIAADGALLDAHVLATVAHGTTGDIVGTSDAQVLSNKDFIDNSTFFQGNADPTKKFRFEADIISAATTRVVTVPDKSFTMGDVIGPASATDNGIATYDTTTGKLIKSLPIATIVVTGNDILTTFGNVVAPATQNNDLFMEARQDISVFLEADTDGVSPDDAPILAMSRKANAVYGQLFNALTGNICITTAQDGSTTDPDFEIFTGGSYANPGQGIIPVPTGQTLALSCNGLTQVVNIPVALTLATSGGSPSNLNYYEELIQLFVSITGAYSSTVNIRLVRIGTAVTLHVEENLNTSTSPSNLTTATGIVPTRFLPILGSSTIYRVILAVRDGGNNVEGRLVVTAAGAITWAPTSGAYASSLEAGFFTHGVCWVTA